MLKNLYAAFAAVYAACAFVTLRSFGTLFVYKISMTGSSARRLGFVRPIACAILAALAAGWLFGAGVVYFFKQYGSVYSTPEMLADKGYSYYGNTMLYMFAAAIIVFLYLRLPHVESITLSIKGLGFCVDAAALCTMLGLVVSAAAGQLINTQQYNPAYDYLKLRGGVQTLIAFLVITSLLLWAANIFFAYENLKSQGMRASEICSLMSDRALKADVFVSIVGIVSLLIVYLGLYNFYLTATFYFPCVMFIIFAVVLTALLFAAFKFRANKTRV